MVATLYNKIIHSAQVTQKVRQSNMELLRIVAMFMIIVYHTVYYVFYEYRGDSPVFASMMTVLHIGVPLFVLISGYFGIKPTLKGFLRLYLTLLFYNLLLYGIRCSLGDVQFSLKPFVKLFFPFSTGKYWWFFKVYLMLYLISPVVNYYRDKTGGGKLLLVSGVLTFYWGWFAQHPSLANGKNVINFIFLYMLGHWLHTMVETRGWRKQNRTWYIVAYVVVAGCIGTLLFFADLSLQNVIKRICYGYNSPVLILMSILFFLIFTTFEFKNKIVNWIGGSALAVYCVHENKYFFKDEWYAYFEEQYLSGINAFPFILLGACACLFILCILLDKVRGIVTRPLMNPIESFIMKHYNKLPQKV